MPLVKETEKQARDAGPLHEKQGSLNGAEEARQTNGSPASARFLQRYVGNNRMQPLVIQAKMVIGRSDDPLEREADEAAARVVSIQEPQGRQIVPCSSDGKNLAVHNPNLASRQGGHKHGQLFVQRKESERFDYAGYMERLKRLNQAFAFPTKGVKESSQFDYAGYMKRLERLNQAFAVPTKGVKESSQFDYAGYMERLKRLNQAFAVPTKGVKESSQFDHAGYMEQVQRLMKDLLIGSSTISFGTFIWPMQGSITSGFGRRKNPVTGKGYEFHSGIDISSGRCDVDIKSVSGGLVEFAGWGGGYGYCVIIDHGIQFGVNIRTLYGHMSRILVSEGMFVAQGDCIGHEGNTGRSTACHLHFQLMRNNSPVDPCNYLP